ncbi:MAG: lysophospholipid acyltransferase family protein [Myxococcales bacterium]
MSAPRIKKNFFFKRVRRELRVRALLLSLPLLKHLPIEAGAALGTLAWYLVGRQRRLALAHLLIAFPEKTEPERRRIGRQSFANLGRAALETLRGDAGRVELSAEDEALLRKAHAEGKGVVLVTGHIGAWELFARRIAALGLPSGTVAKQAQDPRLTALLQQARQSAGVRVFWRGSPMSARELLRFLKAGGMLGVLIDQDTDVAGVHVPFFGRPAFTPRAAGDLAARLHAPMVFGCAHRLAGNVHRIVLRRVDVARTGDRDADSLALTARATKLIEDEIRANPAEWVWMHPRWRR